MISSSAFDRASPARRVRAVALAASFVVVGSPVRAETGDALDASKLQLTFEDRFDRLDISRRGAGTRWSAHTPWDGDFGDARFADPGAAGPFFAGPGGLVIEARKQDSGEWTAGLIASVDPEGRGFGQRYGYFEVRAKLPPGPGVWPAFWLDSYVGKSSPDPSLEIDVLEYYGAFPGAYHSVVTLWPSANEPEKRSTDHIHMVPSGSLSADFHSYGALVEPDWIVIYRDRREVWRTPTPAEHRHKLMILIDLALGGGWPIAATPSPSRMEVEYVRAYSIANLPE